MRKSYLFFIATALIAPFVIVTGAFTWATKNISFPPDALSSTWYNQLLTEAEWLAAIGRSLLISVIAGVIATSVALAISYVLWRTGSGFATGTFAPEASLFWAEVGWYGQMEATTTSHGIVFATLPLVIIARGCAALTDEVIEAAQMMGATPGQVFCTVVFPLVAPYVVTGFALVAIISVRNENMACRIEGAVHATVTDLIGFFDTDTGLPVANPDVQSDQSIAMIVLPARDAFKSELGCRFSDHVVQASTRSSARPIRLGNKDFFSFKKAGHIGSCASEKIWP